MKAVSFICFVSPFRPFLPTFGSDYRKIRGVYYRRMGISSKEAKELPARYLNHCAFSDSNVARPSPVSSISSSMPGGTGEGIEHMPSGVTGNDITLEEWQAWGTSSDIPAMVRKTMDNLKLLERELDIKMNFCGPRGKLQGQVRIEEDKKHRATYKSLSDSEQKLQFFTARQVACRLLGSRGYLCQNCWLPLPDCMCSKLIRQSLWRGIRFWLYMHPKDFLRKNNTGKLLWQVYGMEAAHLCIFGIQEHEKTMWDAFKLAGRERVWCLYPGEDSNVYCVHELNIPKCLAKLADQDPMLDVQQPLNFILIDGTWNNSRAMMSRLKEHACTLWGAESLLCISLSHSNVSVMHRLRPQPSLDRTCTAAAAIQLLCELNLVQDLTLHRLDQSAEALGNSLGLLLNALSDRRERMGRSIVRAQRWRKNE